MESASWTWLRLYRPLDTEMPSWTLQSSQVSQRGCITVVTCSTVVAIVLIKLSCLWVPSPYFAFVLAFRIQHTITNRRTVVPHGTFSCSMVSFRTQIARLTACTFVYLLCSCYYTLSFEWTVHRPIVSFRTVVTSGAFFAGWVRLDGVIIFGTKITSCTVISYQVCSTIVGGCANCAVSVGCVEVGARWT